MHNQMSAPTGAATLNKTETFSQRGRDPISNEDGSGPDSAYRY